MVKTKPVCKYGKNCYRKNPQHLKDFSHPEEPEKEAEQTGDAEEAKKAPKKKEEPKAAHEVSGSEDEDPQPSPKRQKTEEEQKELEEERHEGERGSDEAGNGHDDDDAGKSDQPKTAEASSTTEAEEEKADDGDDGGDLVPLPLPDDPNEAIELLFGVAMHDEFFTFWEWVQTVDKDNPLDALKAAGLRLVGPFDVLAGKFKDAKRLKKDDVLRHWRFYYDPPEFQTLFVDTDPKSGYHMGYWRDSPEADPVFLAENDAEKGGKFKWTEKNIFAAVHARLAEAHTKADMFKKPLIDKAAKSLRKFAEERGIPLKNDGPKNMAKRPGSVANPFHGLGLVVPYDKDTDVGYREIPETASSLKRMLQKVVTCDERTRNKAMEPIDELVTNVQFANDEGDPGMGLELGLNAFTHGGEALHGTCEGLLTVAYMLLRRHAFSDILKAHLKKRQKGSKLSVLDDN